MKLKYMKAFDGDMSKLPKREVEGSVQFKEPEDMNKFALLANVLSLVLTVACLVPVIILSGGLGSLYDSFESTLLHIVAALALCLLIMPIHECVHASFLRMRCGFTPISRRG